MSTTTNTPATCIECPNFEKCPFSCKVIGMNQFLLCPMTEPLKEKKPELFMLPGKVTKLSRFHLN